MRGLLLFLSAGLGGIAVESDLSQGMAALGSPDVEVRREAAERLARLGPEARPAAVPLVRACGDESEEVAQWAAAALEELGPPDAKDLEALAGLLRDAKADTGYWAATLLGRLGEEAGRAVAHLAAALDGGPELSVRQRAAWALGRIGPAARGAVEALRRAEASEDPRLARLAAQALKKIAPPPSGSP